MSKLIEDENYEPSSKPELSQLCRPCQQESPHKLQQGREVRPTYCCLLQTLSLQWQALKYTFLLHYLSLRIQLSQNFNGSKITFTYILFWALFGGSNFWSAGDTEEPQICILSAHLQVTVGTATTPGLQRVTWQLQRTSDFDVPFFMPSRSRFDCWLRKKGLQKLPESAMFKQSCQNLFIRVNQYMVNKLLITISCKNLPNTKN